jgi:DNA-binding NarL/FixJ family response regulator
MRVLVADDEGLFRAGLANLLKQQGHEVVAQARDGFEALELARALQPDVVLMDVAMPRCSGLAATRLIKSELPQIRIVLLAAASEGGELLETVGSGVAGYVIKDRTADELTRALAALDSGYGLEPCAAPVGKEQRCA